MWFLFVWFAHSTGEFVGSFENPNLQSAYEPPWWNDSKPGQSRRTGRVVVRIVADRRRSMKVPHSIHFETLKTHGVCVCDCHPVLWRVNSKQRYDEYGWMGIGPNCCPGASQTPNFLLALWNLSTEKVCLAKGSTCWLYCRGSDAFKLRGALPKVKWWTVWDTLVNAGLMSRSFDFPTSKGGHCGYWCQAKKSNAKGYKIRRSKMGKYLVMMIIPMIFLRQGKSSCNIYLHLPIL